MARKYQGIVRADYGTTSSPATEIANLVTEAGAEGGEASRLEFLDEEGNALDIYGNQYAGVTYVRAIIKSLDTADMSTIRTTWQSDTLQWFKFTLDNSATWTTDNGLLLEKCQPVNIMGRKQGRADMWELSVLIPYDDITIA